MNPSRILVIRIDGIGDLLCITPMLHSLRELFPHSKIDVLANLGPHIVLNGNSDFDRVLIDYRTKVSGSRLKGLRHLATRLGRFLYWKAIGYDLVIVAHYGMHHRATQLARNVNTGLITMCVEPKYQKELRDPRILFAPYVSALHETKGVYSILNSWTDQKPGRMWLYPRKYRANKHRNSSQRLLIGFNLTSSSPQRLWPQERFSELLVSLALEFSSLLFMVMGNPNDVAHFEKVHGALPTSVIIRTTYVNTPILSDFIDAVSECSLFVSSDGGGVHIASALGIPQISLFQNLTHKVTRWAPWQVPNAILHGDNTNAEVGEIEIEKVLNACRTMIQSLLTNISTPHTYTDTEN